MNPTNKDQKTKEEFIKFLNNPKSWDLRFWQSLSVFSKRSIFFGDITPSGEFTNIEDTFYIESDKEGK